MTNDPDALIDDPDALIDDPDDSDARIDAAAFAARRQRLEAEGQITEVSRLQILLRQVTGSADQRYVTLATHYMDLYITTDWGGGNHRVTYLEVMHGPSPENVTRLNLTSDQVRTLVANAAGDWWDQCARLCFQAAGHRVAARMARRCDTADRDGRFIAIGCPEPD